MFKTLPMVASKIDPTTVPKILPEPPLSAVPPIITAAIASSSQPKPVPLLERNPALFWQVMSFVLACIVVLLLAGRL